MQDELKDSATEVPVREVEEYSFPLTFAQSRLWFLNQMKPGGTAYLVPWFIRITGKLDRAVLEQSLNGLIARHETLRTRFEVRDGGPVQVVSAEVYLPLPLTDLSSAPDPLSEAEALQIQESHRPLDLHRAPLLRPHLLRLGEDDHVLLLTTHHVVVDGWSRGVLARELGALYGAHSTGNEPQLPELAVQYGDYAVWEREHFQGEDLARLVKFWKSHLHGAPAVLELPTDRPRPAVESFRGASFLVDFPDELSRKLLDLVKTNRSTLFITMLAGFKALLSRYSGQQDIVIGMPTANRNRSELEGLIGFFANTLIMRTSLEGDPTFAELVDRVKTTAMGAYEHQEMPFEKLVEEINPERSLSHNPIFQVAFSVRHDNVRTAEFSGLQLEFVEGTGETGKFDLSFYVREKAGEITARIECNTDLFDAATVERMVKHYQRLLQSAVADPNKRISELQMLPEAERQQLLAWNQTTAVEYPRDKCLHEMFEAQAAKTPDAIAAVFQEQQLTYAQLNAKANQLAHCLKLRGVGVGDRVGLYIDRSLELVVGLLGIQKSGAAYVPLDPAYPAERLRLTLEEAQVKLLVSEAHLLQAVPLVQVETICFDRDAALLAAQPPENPISGAKPDDVIYVIFTSGSTGRPKGVEVLHRGVVNLMSWMTRQFQLVESDRFATLASFAFDMSVPEIYPPLVTGGRIVVGERHLAADGEELAKFFTQHEITGTLLTPTSWGLLLDAGYSSPRLRRISAAEPLTSALLERMFALSPTPVYNGYGPTEDSVWSSLYQINCDHSDKPVLIGRPIDNKQIYILDAHENLCPIGVPGEIHLGGEGVAKGYLHNPELTAEKFIPDPFSTHASARLYKTGDLGRYLADGNLEFLGRSDHQVKIRGFRIELGEIESVLAAHVAVHQCTVIAREDVEGDKRLVAYVVPEKEPRTPQVDEAALAEQLAQWEAAFDKAYSGGMDEQEATFNIAGWDSSYTGEPIPAEEMRVWVESTAERILSLKARRVWEIGCGTGLLLFRVAPHCEFYQGTDISAAAVGFLQRQLAARALPQVSVSQWAAHLLRDSGEKFDLVVMNSVAQYFPSIEYLLEVIENAAASLRDGGALFLGDIRSLPLLEAFRASVELSRAADEVSFEQMQRGIRQQLRQESELVIDPEFFTVFLRQRIPAISGVDIQLKAGRTYSEMSRFRYDVVLRVGGEAMPPAKCSWLDWKREIRSCAGLRELLQQSSPEIVGISGVPNARVRDGVLAWRTLREGGQGTAAELREQVARHLGEVVEPEDLWQIGRELGYEAEVRHSRSAREDGGCDVVFRRASAELGAVQFPGLGGARARHLESYANRPLRIQALGEAQQRAKELKQWLAEKLPEYMVPSAWMELDELPRLANGKISRKALPAPDYGQMQAAGPSFSDSQNPVEELLAGIWAEVLKLPVIDPNDNFFELGGHSLLATQVMSRLRQTFGVEMPVRALFQDPTVAGLARQVDQMQREQVGVVAPPLVRVSRDRRLPLSFAQQRLWFLDQLEPGGASYSVPLSVRLRGALDTSALRQSLDELVRRHEILRTTFPVIDGGPVQWIAADVAVELESFDATAEAEARRLGLEEIKRPFDLAVGPLLRARLIKMEEHDHAFVLNMHHAVTDGWSTGLLLQDLSALYEAFVAGDPIPAQEPGVQYADYAVWQREYLSGEVLEAQMRYWREQMAGAPAALELPTDRPRPPVQTFRGAKYLTVLPQNLLHDLKTFSRRENATLFMTLLAAFNVLLSRYSGQQDIVVGTPIAGRNRAETEKLIGCFVNTLALRTDLSGAPSFRDLLAQVRETTLAAYAHQDIPFEKLVEELNPERDRSRSPVFQVMLGLQNAAPAPARMGDLELSSFAIVGETAKFDLLVNVTEQENGLRASFEYNTDLFDRATVERLAAHWQVLLETAVAQPEEAVAQLPILAAKEREQLLLGWNQTEAEYARESCLQQRFEAQAREHPERIAAVFDAQPISYGELNHRANQIARHLQTLGVTPGDLVGIYLHRSLDMLAAMIGVLKSGSAYVPLDPAYPSERLEFMVTDSGMTVLLTESSLRASLTEHKAQTLEIDAEEIAKQSAEDFASPATARDLAYVIYTSGSTGKPKGVMIEHQAVVNFMTAMETAPGLTERDTLVAVTTLSFDIAELELWLPLCVGAKVVIASREQAMDGRELAFLMESSGVTVMQATPASWRMLLESGWQGEANLKALCGGEALPQILAQELLPKCGGLWNMYGPTETTIWSSAGRVKAGEAITIGPPIGNTQFYILDPQQNPVPQGVAGELYIGGDGLARGYLNRAELTAEKFVAHPFQPGGKLYRTGDLCRWVGAGKIEYLGRMDQQVKLRGFRIELGEIEAVLSQNPAVAECVVIVRQDEPGDKRLVAYVVPAENANYNPSELREWVKDRLPEYMVPQGWMEMEKLPLSPAGKVDRKALPKPEYTPEAADENRTPTEELIAGIWAEVLKLPSIGASSNFFEIGGHSLLATQVISRVRHSFAVELPLRALFEEPTVRGLAKLIETLQREHAGLSAPPLVPVSRMLPLPLSFAQQRLWFLDQFEPGSGFYNLPLAVRLRGDLQRHALESAINQIVARHEALRTSFHIFEGEPVQFIAETLLVPVPLVDLSDLPEFERDAQAITLAREVARRPFDLAAGPLLRAQLLKLHDDDHVLVINIHHAVSDGWSIGVLEQELSQLYNGSALPPLPVQYVDYAVWQRHYLSGPALRAQMEYWRAQMAGAPTALELPIDRPRPAVQTFSGAKHSAVMPHSLLVELKALARHENATFFMVLLAAFNTLLSRYSGQQDIVVGTPIAGRQQQETERLIGLFVNTLALRTDLSGEPSFRELLGRVRETALGAYAHQDVPFEKLVEELNPERNLGRTPLFQVMLVLQNASAASANMGDLEQSRFALGSVSAAFDLELSVTEMPDGMQTSFTYNTDLFDHKTIVRMQQNFEALLHSIAADANSSVFALPMLPQQERQQMLEEWNATYRDFPRDLCSHDLVAAQVQRTPSATAVVYEQYSLTYAELEARSDRLACYLQAQGIGAVDTVGVAVPRSLDTVIAALAILKSGGACVPLDPSYPRERLRYMIDDSGMKLLLTHSSLVSSLPNSTAKLVCLDDLWPALLAENTTAKPLPQASATSLAFIIYTSGSTGQPKGVLLPHRALVNHHLYAAELYRLTPADRVLQFSSVSFDVFIDEVLPALTCGATVVVRPDDLSLGGPEFLHWLTQQGITLMDLPTAFWHQWVQELNATNAQLPPSLRLVVLGGEQGTARAYRDWKKLAPIVRTINAYGPTEATVQATVNELGDPEHYLRPGLPIGKPVANTQVYLLDRWLAPVPIGVAGELFIGGEGLASGYLNLPELTAEKFIANPFRAGERMYKTGDLATYLPDGTIEFLGRNDTQVKIRGYRVEPEEIESALTQHSQVKDALVIARQEQEEAKYLVGYIVPTQDGLRPEELRVFLRERLPDYMVPSAFVLLSEWPLSPNGKVDRKALPAPDRSRPLLEQEALARTPTEEVLAGIWGEVLRFDDVVLDDNFFEIGGHSLIATQVVSRISQAFAVELPVRALFEEGTIRGLARRVDSLRREQSPTASLELKAAPRNQRLPLSFAQQRLWFLEQMDPAAATYNIPWTVRLHGPLDSAALERSINEIVRRHEALRTAFRVLDDEPVQVVVAEAAVSLPLLDLSALPSAERLEEARRLAVEDVGLAFDLTQAPILRTQLLKLDTDDHVLLMTTHHIVFDGWSFSVFTNELAILYEVFRAGQPSPLPDLALQYADYAVWQRQSLSGDNLDRELDYWRKQLAGAPEFLPLPADHPRENAADIWADIHVQPLSPEITAHARALARAENATVFMVLLAAFDLLLAFLSGQLDMVIGTDLANRTHVDTEPLIGFFINLLPMRAKINEDLTFRDFLRSVKETSLDAYAHQEMPFDKLVEELSPERSLTHNPLVQVLFVMQNTPRSTVGFGGIKLESLRAGIKSRFDMALFISANQQLQAAWTYNPRLFEASTIQRFSHLYQTLLVEALARPDTVVRALLELLRQSENAYRAEERKGMQESSKTMLKNIKRKVTGAS